ncbi:MAG: hypothetical protein M0Z34_01085 [Nitrospiraceae bacterium]|nr:hypothetical protein [Nitrospiraceae bacterium]
MRSRQTDPEALASPNAWTGGHVLAQGPVVPSHSRSWQRSLGAIEPTQLAARVLP